MPKLDQYLLGEFAQSMFAALVVLGMVSLGGVFADILAEMARGKVPPGLLLSQLVTLYTTPVIYLYMERFSEWLARRREQRALRDGSLQEPQA